MDKAAALEIVSRYMPSLTISDALAMIAEMETLTTGQYYRDASLISLKAAKEWAADNFSQTNRETRKIQCIKVLRERFNLGLKEAKDIMDQHISNTYHDYRF